MAHITDVLKKPVLTEKSLALQTEENKYTFDAVFLYTSPSPRDRG